MVIIPINLKIPTYRQPIVVLGDILIRKITQEEMVKYFGVEYDFDENDRVKTFSRKRDKQRWFGYDNLFPSGSAVNEAGLEDTMYPAYVIEAKDTESFYDLNFALRINSQSEFVAPFGFSDNQVFFFRPLAPKGCDRPKNVNYNLSNNPSDIVALYTKLHGKRNEDKLKIVANRYLHSLVWGVDVTTQYIEWVSLIESIILNDNNYRAKANRFGKGLSGYIGTITESDAQKLYKIRNGLVHSGIPTCDGHTYDINTDTSYSASILQAYCRTILKKYVLAEVSVLY